MSSLLIAPTLRTAKVGFDPATSVMEISGISIPENADAFFQPIYNWLDQFTKTHQGKVTVRINLTYFNTSSVRHLLLIIKSMITKFQDQLTVEWMYESDDEEIKERGQQLSEVVKFPFTFIAEEV